MPVLLVGSGSAAKTGDTPTAPPKAARVPGAHTTRGKLQSQNLGETWSGEDHDAKLECRAVIPGGGGRGVRGLLVGGELRLPRYPAPAASRGRMTMTQHVVI